MEDREREKVTLNGTMRSLMKRGYHSIVVETVLLRDSERMGGHKTLSRSQELLVDSRREPSLAGERTILGQPRQCLQPWAGCWRWLAMGDLD